MIKKSLFLFLVTIHLTTYTADLNTLMLSAYELRAQQEQEEKEEAILKKAQQELQEALAAKRRREKQEAELEADRRLAEILANPRRELTRGIKPPDRYNPDDHSVPKRTLSKARKRTGKKAKRHFNQKSMGPLGKYICATCVFSHRDPKVVEQHYITHRDKGNN